jgi:hypothetical protein
MWTLAFGHHEDRGLVRTTFPPAKGIQLLGVTLSSLENGDKKASKQLDLSLVGP